MPFPGKKTDSEIQNEEMENEQIEDDTEESESGSQLSVIMKHKIKYYQSLMFYNTIEIGVPVMLLQTITFLVRLIEEIEPSQLIEHLTRIATDPLIPHNIPDKEFRDIANKC